MTAGEYLKTKNRMCNTIEDGCFDCPFDKSEIGLCNECEENRPDEAIAIVEKWGKEHPIATLMDKFFKAFPDAPRSRAKPKYPRICPSMLGYKTLCLAEQNCEWCWSQPYVEPKGETE